MHAEDPGLLCTPQGPEIRLQRSALGTGENSDPNADNDGVSDAQDALPFDATESLDTDGDGFDHASEPSLIGASHSEDHSDDRRSLRRRTQPPAAPGEGASFSAKRSPCFLSSSPTPIGSHPKSTKSSEKESSFGAM